MNNNSLFIKAMHFYNTSSYCEAVELFDRIIDKNPECEECYYYAGQCCEKVFFECKAIEYYLKGIEKCIDEECISDYHLDIGNCYIKLSKIDEAIFHYDEASKFEDNYLMAQFNKAKAFVCINKFNEALSIFENVKNNNTNGVINTNKLDGYLQFCKKRR